LWRRDEVRQISGVEIFLYLVKYEKYTPFALFTHERCRDVAILPT